MVYVFLAEGFEECEALAPVDILRRGGVDAKTVGIGSKTVTGSHNISVIADLTENEITFENLEGIILPGGMPGTINLEKSATVQAYIDYAEKNSLLIGAICAAPSILGHKGILKGKKATCFNGFEDTLSGAVVLDEPVVKDGNIITAYGAGASFLFGFSLLGELTNQDEALALMKAMKYKN